MNTRPYRVHVLVTLVLAILCVTASAAVADPADAVPGPLALVAIQQAVLTSADGAAGDHFGYAVAIDGDTAIVGSDSKDIDGRADQGAAYVFTRSGGVWTLQQQLTASDAVASDHFGNAVALSGDTALVGAYWKTIDGQTQHGAAYVFTRSGGVWTQQQRLTSAGGYYYDYFGWAVALSGDTALVGAGYEDLPGRADQGAAYVFTRSGGVWTQQQRLTPSDGAAFDYFGTAAALSTDTAVIGAQGKDVDGNVDQGAAYVFTLSAGAWTQQQRLTAGDGAADEFFGTAVALSGDTAAIGASKKDIGGNQNQGAAYVYTRSAGAWTQQQRLTAADGATSDFFGTAIALAGDTALVGAGLANPGGSVDQGAAYTFTRSTDVWTQQQRLTGSNSAADDRFGSAVALSADAAVIGARYAHVGGVGDQGAAYAFTFVTCPAITVVAPTATSSWPSTTTQTVSWNLSSAVPGGEFRVSLVNQSSGIWYVNKVVAGVASRTEYGTAVRVTAPAGPYKAAVYWRPTIGSGGWEATAKSAVFTVPEAPPLQITSPSAADIWPAQATRIVSWEVAPALEGGEFHVWLVNTATSTWYVNKTVPAVADKTSYSTAITTTVPAGIYKAAVYWRATPGSGVFTLTTKSSAFTVASLAVTSPTASSSWRRLTTQAVEWKMDPALSDGEFRVSLVSAANIWYANKSVPVVPAQTDYSATIYLNVPAGSYRAAVYWKPTGSSAWVLTQKSAAFTVTP